MTEKPETLKPVKLPRTAEERKHWGEMREPIYPARKPGLGAWLVGVLTAWKR